MAEKHLYTLVSTPSNQVVLTRPGVLHAVLVNAVPAGATVRIDDTQRFAAGTVSASATSSNTVGQFTSSVWGLNIGLNTGLVVAASSNGVATLVYE